MADNDELKAMLDALRREGAAEHAETRRLFDETAARIATENREFFRSEAEGLRQEFREGIAGATNEFGHQLGITADGLRQEFREGIAEATNEFGHQLGITADGLRQEFRHQLGITADGLRQEFREGIAGATNEFRHQLGITAEALRHEIQLVAEGVISVGQKLEREGTDIRAELHRTAADTQAMIKFSHAELAQRVGKLEDAVTDLQARVERLEGSTH